MDSNIAVIVLFMVVIAYVYATSNNRWRH